MSEVCVGRLLDGERSVVEQGWRRLLDQPVDQVSRAPAGWRPPSRRRTIAREASATGPGTFRGNTPRTLTFLPSTRPGWQFDRVDLAHELPIRVATENVWTTHRNIVLRSGSPHNYMRMVEHIIALKPGMLVDDLVIRMQSGDPPLFDRGSLDLVEALEEAGIAEGGEAAPVFTVREPVSLPGPNGSFLALLPASPDRPWLDLDVAIDFPNAIGLQRLQLDVTPDSFRYGAQARTNTTFMRMALYKTVGKLLADVRHLGYTRKNILIACKRKYYNEAQMPHNGKSLEAVWHRAVMDLVAALALFDGGRLALRAVSYKAGHTLDCVMMRHLERENLIVPL